MPSSLGVTRLLRPAVVLAAGLCALSLTPLGSAKPLAEADLSHDESADVAAAWSGVTGSPARGTVRPVKTAPDGSGTLTAEPTSAQADATGVTLVFKYRAATKGTAGGTLTLAVPDGWSAPSLSGNTAGFTTASTGTVAVSGQTITVDNLTLLGGATFSITYGARGAGGPGATAPAEAATQVWPAKERSSATGTLTALASSPSVTLTAPSAAAPPPPPPPPPPASDTMADRAGIAAGGSMHNLSADVLGRYLDEVKALGGRWIRVDVNWSLIQAGGPASYDWAPFDRVVQAATARGLKVLATPLYTPGWARPGTPDSTYPPADLSTYASFCRAAVQHYAPLGVHTWEVWNEPNIGFWKPSPDPERYTALLKLAYAAIKAADPQAFVLSAGLSPYGAYGQASSTTMNPLTFLERMYKAGAAGSFDALGWHPYNFAGIFYHPASAWSQLSETTPSARSLMTAYGDGAKQIWGTEFGAPTGTSGDAVTEAAQAKLVTDAFAKWRTWSWAGPLFWFSYRDEGTNLSDREQNFGLIRFDFSHKPSYAAFATVAAS